MESVTEFRRGSRHLRKLLKQQLDHESCPDHLTRSATTADPHLTLHTQVLYNTRLCIMVCTYNLCC